MTLKRDYHGNRNLVRHCRKAVDSYTKASMSLAPHKKKRRITLQLINQLERLAHGEEMSKETFRREAKLPGRVGRQEDRYFYALKRIPIRGYCWESERLDNTYFISHYIYKDFDNLDDRDTERLKNNWRRIEVDNDES